MTKNEQPIIFTTPEFAEQGEKFTQSIGGSFGNSRMRYETFPDGTPNINFADVQGDVRGEVIYWLGDFSSMQTLFSQYAALGALVRYGARALNILNPYFSVGTMERIVTNGDVVTAKAMMRLLESLPQCRTSLNQVSFFDLHDPRESFYVGDELFVESLSFMESQAKNLPEDAVIAFPDLGAKKRFGNLFGKRKIVIFEKLRNQEDPTKEEKQLTLVEGENWISNAPIVLIDDLVMTGGTLKGAARILRDKGAKTVDSLFTHPVFPGNKFENFVQEFDGVTTSDTVPLQAAKLSENPKVTINSIVPILAESIRS